jgi:hypothetical protein
VARRVPSCDVCVDSPASRVRCATSEACRQHKEHGHHDSIEDVARRERAAVDDAACGGACHASSARAGTGSGVSSEQKTSATAHQVRLLRFCDFDTSFRSEVKLGIDLSDIDSGDVVYDGSRAVDDADELSQRDRGMSVLPCVRV